MRGFLVAYFSFVYAHTVRCLHSGVESRARRRGFQLKTKKRIRTDSGNYGNRLTKEGRRRGRGVYMCEGETERERKRRVGGLARCLCYPETHSHNFGSANQRLSRSRTILSSSRDPRFKPNKIKLCVVRSGSSLYYSPRNEKGKKGEREKEYESAGQRRCDRWPEEKEGKSEGERRRRRRKREREREGSNQSWLSPQLGNLWGQCLTPISPNQPVGRGDLKNRMPTVNCPII